ncbi:restriction endonuclease [Cryobacterium melibiosiphilum]|uniref:Restriction endonuclease n=1 Tax=Cryobacterium melibiosiphilum TaxID=995039 RepID=A0A3A5MJP8_9MICO|nr:restriction endonuclease [Cryobacterium melibiosiphilum]RJT87248.1 restriction endonuclease [Cryobacterium melibiosiphilum]
MSDPTEPDATANVVSAVPQWPVFMKPLLEVLSDGNAWPTKELEQATLDRAGVSEASRNEVLPSGGYRARNRIGWATAYLLRAQALSKPARAVVQIEPTGRDLLTRFPNGLDKRDLETVPAYQAYIPQRGKVPGELLVPAAFVPDVDEDPTELIEAGVEAFAAEAAAELIRRLRAEHPDFFEQAVVDVLNKMGYGGTEQRGRRLGGSGDGGVDGVIDQDALGLSQIYVQAKRYGEGNSVQRPEIQGFVGALLGKGASQGIFVTTSLFSRGAAEYARSIQTRVVLIDGPRLAELMIRYRVGVQVKQTYEVIEVDEDYFE